MSHVIDRIFAEVCLDERVKDGIFKLDEDEHMSALRDLFVKKGLTRENATSLTNRMVEGKFPERQAFNKDGILVTFPTPQHKAKAIARGTHFEKNPNPQAAAQKQEPEIEEPKKNVGPDVAPPKEKDTEEDDEKADKDDEEEDSKGSGGGGKKVQQGDKELDVAPPQGEQPEAPPAAPQVPQQPQTPERIAAQKAVVQQMIATDNTDLGSIDPGMTETCKLQLAELFRRGQAMGLSEACGFLKTLVKV
jgi:hypothetical protein